MSKDIILHWQNHKEILAPLLNRKMKKIQKNEEKDLRGKKKVKNKSDVKKYIWHMHSLSFSLAIYEWTQRISTFILKYSAMLPNKHKIVNPCEKLYDHKDVEL